MLGRLKIIVVYSYTRMVFQVYYVFRRIIEEYWVKYLGYRKRECFGDDFDGQFLFKGLIKQFLE